MITDPAGDDLCDHLRGLILFHEDSHVTREILQAIRTITDNHADGAPDAGSVAHACTRIASLAREELDQ